MDKKPNILLRIIDNIDGVLVGIIMAIIFIDVMLQISTRVLPIRAFAWTNELGEIMLSAPIWFGVSAAVKTNNHIGFDLFFSKLSPGGKTFTGPINIALFPVYLCILAYLP